MGVAQFAEQHGLSSQRVRVLIRAGRVYPVERLGSSGPYVIYPNAVIVPPFRRPNRRLRGQTDS